MVSAEVFRNTHLLMATMLLFTLMGRPGLLVTSGGEGPYEELERVCGQTRLIKGASGRRWQTLLDWHLSVRQ
jgi:hypothetical protein